MTLEEKIDYLRGLISNYEEIAERYFYDDKICYIARMEARKQAQVLEWLEELRLYRLKYDKAAERIISKMNQIDDYIIFDNKKYINASEVERILKNKDILKENEE